MICSFSASSSAHDPEAPQHPNDSLLSQRNSPAPPGLPSFECFGTMTVKKDTGKVCGHCGCIFKLNLSAAMPLNCLCLDSVLLLLDPEEEESLLWPTPVPWACGMRYQAEESPWLGAMLICHHPDICNAFSTRGPVSVLHTVQPACNTAFCRHGASLYLLPPIPNLLLYFLLTGCHLTASPRGRSTPSVLPLK